MGNGTPWFSLLNILDHLRMKILNGPGFAPTCQSLLHTMARRRFCKIIKSPLSPPWPMRSDPSRVARWCLSLPPHPCHSLPLPATPFSSPSLYPHGILSSSENIPRSLNFRPSHMLFALPSSQDVCQSNSYLCFSFSSPPRSLLGPLFILPLPSHLDQPRQRAGFLPFAPPQAPSMWNRGVLFVLSHLNRPF